MPSREKPASARRVALVTGGASGIGAATASRLAEEGTAVLVADRNGPGAVDIANRILQAGGEAAATELDVTSTSDCEKAVAAVVGRFGGLDSLVHCAGIAGSNHPVAEIPDAEWQRVIDVNLGGTFRMSRAAVGILRDSPAGRVVLLASVAGKEGNPGASAYSASKAGVIALAKSLGKELVRSDVLVNAVTPALIDTPMVNQSSPEHIAYMTSKIPMGRLGRPEEIAALISWLSSPLCSFSTGSVFDISGGRSTY